ncbi:hypothetical protein [Streptomyces sp. NPDC054804]
MGIDTLIDDLLAPTADDHAATEETYAEEADTQGIGRPFSDVGPTRSYAWHALGVDWEITCPNERLSALATERYTAALQVFLGELATQELLFLPGRVSIEIRVDATLSQDQPAVCGQSAEREQGTPRGQATTWSRSAPGSPRPAQSTATGGSLASMPAWSPALFDGDWTAENAAPAVSIVSRSNRGRVELCGSRLRISLLTIRGPQQGAPTTPAFSSCCAARGVGFSQDLGYLVPGSDVRR